MRVFESEGKGLKRCANLRMKIGSESGCEWERCESDCERVGADASGSGSGCGSESGSGCERASGSGCERASRSRCDSTARVFDLDAGGAYVGGIHFFLAGSAHTATFEKMKCLKEGDTGYNQRHDWNAATWSTQCARSVIWQALIISTSFRHKTTIPFGFKPTGFPSRSCRTGPKIFLVYGHYNPLSRSLSESLDYIVFSSHIAIMGAYPSTRRLNKANELFSEFNSLSRSHIEHPTRETKTLLRRIVKHYKKAIKGLRKHNESNLLGNALSNLATIEWEIYQRNIKLKCSVEVSSECRLKDIITYSTEALTIWEDYDPKPDGYDRLRGILAEAYRELEDCRSSVPGSAPGPLPCIKERPKHPLENKFLCIILRVSFNRRIVEFNAIQCFNARVGSCDSVNHVEARYLTVFRRLLPWKDSHRCMRDELSIRAGSGVPSDACCRVMGRRVLEGLRSGLRGLKSRGSVPGTVEVPPCVVERSTVSHAHAVGAFRRSVELLCRARAARWARHSIDVPHAIELRHCVIECLGSHAAAALNIYLHH
ncbi:hypothetical protein BJ912DRAFT_1041448 [Pholiota molesta]|nr:hypothetical protein BJ912DRAFT_1041448 [Pholiota molesta]